MLGMRLLVASLSMLFAASIVGYVVIRSRSAIWPPAGSPPLPGGLWLSTVLLLISSGTMCAATMAARRDAQRQLRVGLLLTTLLGVGFLASQTANWSALVARHLTPGLNLFGFTFFLLTGLHAAHVVGGLVPLSVVTVRAWKGRYSAAFHPGVRYCALYWHFLDVVWVILFGVVFLAG
ncbi:MAG: cytochrome c oxidase subunit 3 [Acidobacteriota bacterium]